MQRNNSYGFLLPAIFPKGNVPANVTDTYLALDFSDPLGEAIYVYVKDDDLGEKLPEFTRPTSYTNSIKSSSGTVFRYEFTEEQKQKIVEPFLQGKYSQIDGEYVRENFQSERKRNALMVIKMAEELRLYWLRRGVEIPQGQEVWSKPDPMSETYIKIS